MRGGVSAASITFSTSPTVASYSIQPVRSSTNAAATPVAAPPVVKTSGGPHDIPLERGAWKLVVTALSKADVPSPPTTSATVIIGTPLAATGVVVQGSAGKASLTFTCVGVGWGEQPQAAEHAAGE